MWGSTFGGSTFADLAEKARKQAEELSTQVQTSAVVSDGLSGVGGLFNLDSIQQNSSQDDEMQEQQRKVLSEKLSSEVVEFDTGEEEIVNNEISGFDEQDVSNKNEDAFNDHIVNVNDVNTEEIVAENRNNDMVNEPTAEAESNIDLHAFSEKVTEEVEEEYNDEDGWDEEDIPLDDDIEVKSEKSITPEVKEVEPAASKEPEENGFFHNSFEDVSSTSSGNIWSSPPVSQPTNVVEEIAQAEIKQVEHEEEEQQEYEDDDNIMEQTVSPIQNKVIENNVTSPNVEEEAQPLPETNPIETPKPTTPQRRQEDNIEQTVPPIQNEVIENDTSPKVEEEAQIEAPEPTTPQRIPIDATPPHMVQKFMQQIQRITEHHKTEMSELEQKLQEKDDLLRQYQEQPDRRQDLERTSSSDKFKELQKQEEYYKKLVKEQTDKLDDERSQNTALKTSLTQLEEKHKNYTISVKSDMETQRVEFKEIIQNLEMELSNCQRSEKEVKDKMEILDIELSEKEEIYKNKSMEYEKIIKTKNVQLEEERTKVGMFQSNLDTLLEKEKDNETSSVEDKIQIQKLQGELSKFQNELDNQIQTSNTLEETLRKTEQEKIKSQEQYEALKARVKVVATELKERRQENRDLKSANSNLNTELVLLKDEKEKLKTELDNSKSYSMDNEQQSEEYQIRVKEMEEELEEIQKKYSDAESVGNVALQQYKKKAQAALANANARAASANQRKEEMEVEFRSLKAAAEEAEAERKEAVRERVEGIDKVTNDFKKLDEAYQTTSAELTRMTQKANELSAEKDNLEQGLQDSINEQHRLYDEIQKLSDEVSKQREMANSYSAELDQEKSITRDLTNSLRNFKEQHERSAAAAFMAKQRETSGLMSSLVDASSADHAAGIAADSTKHVLVQNEGMVTMLQEELDGANEAVKELKKELRDALTREKEREAMQYNVGSISSNPEQMVQQQNLIEKHETSNNSSTTPLFYAIEKQAELKIARDEINRLANLVSELETRKQAAWEEKEEFRKNMEEAEARLRRHEKLGASARPTPVSSRASPYSNSYNPTPKPESSENLNLEYLKNITLRYIKASNTSERKALIPVIAAVLCLTEDETQNAMNAVDSSRLGNVGNALLESTKYFLS